MYFNPYLRRPDVPGASRCRFIFYSQEVLSRDDEYTGKRRYRFNKWLPISEAFPDQKSEGLVFAANQQSHLSGIASAFTIDPTDTGSISFLFAPQTIKKFDVTKDHIEVAAGFLKYSESWWSVAEGCELLYHRAQGVNYNGCFSTRLRNVVIPTAYNTFNPTRYAKFNLNYSPTVLSIVYEEYTDSGAILHSHTVTLPNDNTVQKHPYRAVFYIYSDGDCAFQIPLVRTTISLPKAVIANQETIYFKENPDTYQPPMAPLRDRGIHIYQAPHVALVEDGTITVGNSYASSEWYNTLKFLMNSSVEPVIFTDPDGIDFRCVFSDLTANTAMVTDERGSGYTLTLPVVVAH